MPGAYDSPARPERTGRDPPPGLHARVFKTGVRRSASQAGSIRVRLRSPSQRAPATLLTLASGPHYGPMVWYAHMC